MISEDFRLQAKELGEIRLAKSNSCNLGELPIALFFFWHSHDLRRRAEGKPGKAAFFAAESVSQEDERA